MSYIMRKSKIRTPATAHGNLEKMIGLNGTMFNPIGEESIGANAGVDKNGNSRNALNFYYNEKGEIQYIGNSQHSSIDLTDLNQGAFLFSLVTKLRPDKTIDILNSRTILTGLRYREGNPTKQAQEVLKRTCLLYREYMKKTRK